MDDGELSMTPVKVGSAGKPVVGFDLRILSDEGVEVGADVVGNIVIKLPLPPGTLPGLWNNEEGFQKAYLQKFPGG